MRPSGHLDVCTEELETLLERAQQEPLEPDGYEKLRAAIRTLGYVTQLLENREATLEALQQLLCQSSTEKTTEVLKRAGIEVDEKDHKHNSKSAPPGHGRNGAAAYRNASKVQVQHARLVSGDLCPDCERGKVYPQRDPGLLVRIQGQPPIDATVYESNGCGAICAARFLLRMRRRVWAIRSMMRRQQA
jgi:transposase